MHKTQLIDQLTTKLGDRKTASEALDAFVDVITTTVAAGEKVTIPGFGSWESVQRPARDARNPATGEAIHIPATNVPKFKVGASFRAAVNGHA
jgi:DNA-binding protein HU-beta